MVVSGNNGGRPRADNPPTPGSPGFKKAKKARLYPWVKDMLDNGHTTAHVIRSFSADVAENTLRDWIRQAAAELGLSDPPSGWQPDPVEDHGK